MAVQAPPHLEGVDPVRDRHFILNFAVALLAAHAAAHVAFVAEVHEVGKVVDLLPRNRLARSVVLFQLFEFGAVIGWDDLCLLYTSPSPRDGLLSRMPSSA